MHIRRHRGARARRLVARRRHLPGVHPQLRRRRRRRHRRPRRPALDGSTTCATSVSTRSGSTRGTRRRWPTPATTSPTTATSTPRSARSPTPTALIARGARARPAGACSTSCPTTPPTSTRWFQAALAAGPGSPERERYLFRDGRGPDGERAARTTGSAASAGRRGPASPSPTAPPASGTCTCSTPEQPDLNWDHPEVAAEFEDVAAVLVRPRRRRLPHRRGALLVKEAGLPDVAEPCSCRSAQPIESTDRHPHWDRDGGARDLPRRGARSPTRTTRRAIVRRRGLGARPDAARPLPARPTSCTPRSTSTSSARRGAPADLRDVDRRHARRARTRSARRRPGCCPTTTSPGRCRATPASQAHVTATSCATSPAPADLELGSGGRARPRC